MEIDELMECQVVCNKFGHHFAPTIREEHPINLLSRRSGVQRREKQVLLLGQANGRR
jgi:hypothetical protein